jgi:hypothetical protein
MAATVMSILPVLVAGERRHHEHGRTAVAAAAASDATHATNREQARGTLVRANISRLDSEQFRSAPRTG